MEPSVSLAATILESLPVSLRSRQCTNQTVYRGGGWSPSYKHNSFLFAFATGFNSTLSFPCSLWQGCGGGEKEVAMATAPSPTVAELSLWRAHFLPVTETKQGNIVTQTWNVRMLNKSCTNNFYHSSNAKAFFPVRFFVCPLFFRCHSITGKYRRSYICSSWYKHKCFFLSVDIMRSWSQNDPHLNHYNKSELDRERMSANIMLLSLALSESLFLPSFLSYRLSLSTVFSPWYVSCPTFSQTATPQEIFVP